MRRYIVIFIFAILLAGCAKEHKSGVSVVSFGVKAGTEDVIIRGTKAAADGRTYRLTVLNGKGESAGEISDLTTVNNSLTLATGSYVAKVESGVMSAAAFDAPYYVGERAFDVSAYKDSEVDVNLKLGNVKVSVEYSDALKALLSNAELLVTLVDGGTLDYAYSETKAGYFKPAGSQNSIKWSIALYPLNGGREILNGTVKEIKANDHLIIRFGVGADMSSGFTIGDITVDESISKVVEDNFQIDFSKLPQVVLVGGDITQRQDLVKNVTTPLSPMVVTISGFPSINGFSLSHNMLIGGGNSIEVIKDGSAVNPDKIALYKSDGVEIEFLSAASGASNPLRVTLDEKFINSLPANGVKDVYEITFNVTDENGKILNRKLSFTITDNSPAPTSDVVMNELMRYEKWSTKLELGGYWNGATKPSTLQFEYKKKSETTWIPVVASSIDNASKTFKATVLNLIPDTDYQIRAKGSSVSDNVVEARTESATQMYNSNLDLWSLTDKVTYPREDASKAFWDSGNKGAKMGGSVLTEAESTDVIGGKAAKLTTKKVLGIAMAAGNLFVGEFTSASAFGDDLDITFGRPFTARPNALTGYYKYKSTTINDVHSSKEHLKGKPDRFSMTVILTDKPISVKKKNMSPFDIDLIQKNGTDGTVRAVASAHFTNEVIKDGLDKTVASDMASYEEFTMKLKYHEANKDLEPKYIIVIFAASKYGDFFTGGVNTTLLLDELMLDYNFGN